MTDYLVFNELKNEFGKTKIFEVRNKTHNDLLGTICWSSAWRQYIFRNYALVIDWSSGCLTQLHLFIDELMIKRHIELKVMDELDFVNLLVQASDLIIPEVRKRLVHSPPAELNLKEVLLVFKSASSDIYWKHKGVNY